MIANDGIGIAAPQCGILKRIIIATVNNNVLALINPEIIEFSNEIECAAEGCLSVPGKTILVERYKSIKVKYRNLKGKPVCETYQDLDARVIQHEINHLDGILIN
jgi:peptide deformylase